MMEEQKLLVSSSVTANEATLEFPPSDVNETNDDAKFCSPHLDMDFFSPPIFKDLKLGGHILE